MRLRCAAFVAVGVGTLGACAVNKRPPTTVAAIAADAPALNAAHRATLDSMVERLARRAVTRGDRTLDILLLSGGGQNGAYGAGFLRGWRTRSESAMPRFDLVTGVSTGALQAPFAVLGTEAAIDTVSALYLGAADRIAPSIDWWFWLRRTGGVVKTARYRATLQSVLDERMRDALAKEFREDRQLLVATTDFDLGVGRVWDMGRELGTSKASLDRAVEIFIASTAIPGIFPPTTIDGHVQIDGGVISNVLTGPDLDGYRTLAERLRARGVADSVTVRVWVVMNLWTHMGPVVADPSSRGSIQSRNGLLMLFAQQPQVLNYLSTLAQAVTATVPGLKVEVRYTAVPAELATDPAAGKLFDKAWMQRLETLGYERARSANQWDAPVSPYERPPTSSPEPRTAPAPRP